MDFLAIVFIAISLSADCFAVALCDSLSPQTHAYRRMFRVAFAFGLVQTLMPVIGWLVGRTIIGFIEDYDHWAAFALLAGIGARMLWEAFHSESEDACARNTDITKWFLLLTLSVATSVDALAVGLSFAFININILVASLIIGAVAFIITAIGFLVGRRVGGLFGKWARVAGGVILIAIGIKILLSHILG